MPDAGMSGMVPEQIGNFPEVRCSICCLRYVSVFLPPIPKPNFRPITKFLPDLFFSVRIPTWFRRWRGSSSGPPARTRPPLHLSLRGPEPEEALRQFLPMRNREDKL